MIRQAVERDIPKIGDLLLQVDRVHHMGRPDIFQIGRKYDDAALKEILHDADRPVLVATDEQDAVLGYCFCVYQQHKDHPVMTPIKTLYIDDLCVDETMRGKHVGKELYRAAVELARQNGCYNVTLNVWSCNPTALAFYESCGMTPQKIGMEQIL